MAKKMLYYFGVLCVFVFPAIAQAQDVDKALYLTTVGPASESEECVPYVTPFWAGQTIFVGYVQVTTDQDDLVISVQTNSPWTMKELHVYAGTGPIPGLPNPAPGQFPYKYEFTPFQSAYTLRIALTDLGVTCDDNLNIAVHATVVKVVGGEVVDEQTAWAEGPNEFGGRWGWWFVYTVCCENGGGGEDCTLTIGYWKTHNKYRNKPSQNIPWPIDGSEDFILCGKKWLQILWTKPKKGDAWTILARQWIGATLNIAAGASAPPDVLNALNAAEDLLLNNCSGIPKRTGLRRTAICLAKLLDSYNKGRIGPGHCDD